MMPILLTVSAVLSVVLAYMVGWSNGYERGRHDAFKQMEGDGEP